MLHEVSVDIFQRSTSCLRVEQVHERHKGEVEDGPDDVEFPAEGPDADWGDFYNDKVAWQ